MKEEVDALIKAVKESECYNAFLLYKKKLSEDKALFAKLQQMKKWQLNVEGRKLLGEEVGRDEEEYVNEAYFSLLMDENCAGYLENEQKVLHMLSEIYRQIADSVDLDMSFMED